MENNLEKMNSMLEEFQNKNKSTRTGTSFCSLLTITFIVLKLCNVISWSWWWVLAPLWIPLSLVIILLIFLGVIICIKD